MIWGRKMNIKHRGLVTIAAFTTIGLLMYEPANADVLDNFYTKFEVGNATPQKLENEKLPGLGGKYNRWNEAPEDSVTYGVGFGYQFNEGVRADFVITNFQKFRYRAEVDTNPDPTDEDEASISQDLKSTAFILNLYGVSNAHKVVKPFISFGAGVASNNGGEVKTIFEDETKRWVGPNKTKMVEIQKMRAYPEKRTTSFAWNVQAGFSLAFTERINLDVFYRYLDLGTVSTEVGERNDKGKVVRDLNPFKAKLMIHNVGAALRLKY